MPDGTRVVIQLSTPGTSATELKGSLMSPEEIAGTLAAMENVKPFDLTDAERSDIQAWRDKMKEYSKAIMDRDIDALFE